MSRLDYTYVFSDDGAESVVFGDSEVIWSVNLLPDTPPAGFDQADYRALLGALLPLGIAWPRAAESTLQRLLDALAAELARLDERARALIGESDPRAATELLPEWERMAGLPDSCTGASPTLAVRRATLEGRLTSVGGQSKSFFRVLAARLGFSIEIDEFFSEAAAIAAGIPYVGTSWATTWRVRSGATTVRDFRVGQATVGEPLRTWGNQLLECSLNRLKPAHTTLLFAFS